MLTAAPCLQPLAGPTRTQPKARQPPGTGAVLKMQGLASVKLVERGVKQLAGWASLAWPRFLTRFLVSGASLSLRIIIQGEMPDDH